MLEIIVEFLSENVIQLLLGAGTIICVWIGKPKTAEKLKKLKEKKLAKLKEKMQKYIDKLKELNTETENIEKELNEK